MTGQKCTRDVLNNTLLYIIKLLNKYDIKNWFICYGTLLGIVRENNCIDGDDDIDIIVHKNYYDKIKEILISNGFNLEYALGINNSKNIIKTKESEGFSSIDIYMSEIDDNGNCIDLWNRLLLTDCYVNKEEKNFIEKIWNGEKLYIPNNYIKKLVNRYGKDWEIKKDEKPPQTMMVL
jgi:hypothetical protein